jgi:hypothetical protein
MDQKQFEAMLSEAETRLRRLKMLYEQWFMGFERIEPATLRKELEDLLARLRKEQMRNTALRFRLQQLVQRHTTFTTYWRRIGRQIEEGTYQRDVLRAKRVRSRAAEEHDDPTSEQELSYDVDLDGELEAALEQANSATEVATSLPSPASSVELKAPFLAPVTAVVPVVPSPGRGLAMPPSAADGLATRAARVAAPAAPAPAGARAGGQRSLSPFSTPAPATASAAKPLVVAKPAPPQAPATPGSAKPLVVAKPAPPQAPANAAGAKPLVVAKPAPPQAAATPLVADAAAKPLSAARPAPPSASGARASRRPAAPPSPRATAQAATPSPAAPRDDGSFSSDDVQRIYTQYLAARKQNAERVDNVKRDTIEKTIRGMLPQLEKKHAGKKIDFEVVVKDGKVALKPVAK